MNNKAFTLVELLAVIVIIALLAGIGMAAYSTFVTKTTNKAFEYYQDTMHAEAIKYLSKNYNNVTYTDDKIRINLANLSIERINNPKNSSDTCINNNSYVEATKSYSTSGVLSISYKVCLSCPNSGFSNCKIYDN